MMPKNVATFLLLDSVAVVIFAPALYLALVRQMYWAAFGCLAAFVFWKWAMWRTLTRLRTFSGVDAARILERMADYVADEQRRTRLEAFENYADSPGLSRTVVFPGDQL
jgi:hypothetical protein